MALQRRKCLRVCKGRTVLLLQNSLKCVQTTSHLNTSRAGCNDAYSVFTTDNAIT